MYDQAIARRVDKWQFAEPGEGILGCLAWDKGCKRRVGNAPHDRDRFEGRTHAKVRDIPNIDARKFGNDSILGPVKFERINRPCA
ncbi:hypothetical protein MesoLjLb_71100 [Mesorhizobium sp. L-8-3]|nr:hypothetical protein MesoLjLb_71100 [Mesorhizobium sp. L-8-3]